MTFHSNYPKTITRFGFEASCSRLHRPLTRCPSATTLRSRFDVSQPWCGNGSSPSSATARKVEALGVRKRADGHALAGALQPPAPGWRVPGKTCAARNLVQTVHTFNHGSGRDGQSRHHGPRGRAQRAGPSASSATASTGGEAPGSGVAEGPRMTDRANCGNQMVENGVKIASLPPMR
jgi:hypothetical protein